VIKLRSRRGLGAYVQLVAGVALMAMAFSGLGLAATAPSLGAASSFSVLGGQTVTNTGPSVLAGDVGVSPGTSITGFPPGITLGVVHAADPVAGQAQAAVTTAYNSLAGQACDSNLTGQDLGGMTLTAGAYCFSSSAQLTGHLTLDAQGNANAVFVFQIVSTLTTASSASVSLINGGSPCNVFWQVGSSATLGTGTTFVGNILALTSISVTTGTTVTGRALARNGAVSLDTDTFLNDGCITGGGTTGGGTTGGGTTGGGTTGGTTGGPGPGQTPELDSFLLFGAGALGVAGYARSRFMARRRGKG
jgi:hypothetical protein